MKIGPTFLLLLLFLQGFGRQGVDLNQTPETPNDSTQIWMRWARDSTELTTYQKIGLLNKSIDYLQKKDPGALYKISAAALSSGDSILFKNISKKVLTISEKENQRIAQGTIHWDYADFYKKNKPDSAFYHLQEAYTIFAHIELDESTLHYPGGLLIEIGNLKDDIKDYVGSEKDFIEAVKYFNQANIKERLFGAYNSLGVSQNGLNKFDKALEYHEKAKEMIPFARKNRQYRYHLMNKNNVASIYMRKGDFRRAHELYSELLIEDSLFIKRPSLYAKVLSSEAYSGFKSGLENYEEFEQAFEKSNYILDSLGVSFDKARNNEFHAQVLAAKNDTLGAIKKALVAIKIAKETSNNDRLLSSLKLLTTIDKKNSAAYAKDYFELSEELQQKERAIQDKFARIRMETDEIIEENESLAKQKRLYAGIVIALLILAIGVFIIVSQRISNQKLKFEQKQQENNQEIYNLMLTQQGKLEEGKKSEKKRISEELHDGILGQMLGIRLILTGLNEREDEAAITQRAELIEKLRELEEEIRTISHELNTSAYEKIHNFMLSIEELITTLYVSTNIDIRLKYDQDFSWDTLGGDIKINIYRIVQECLQNCIKHANCKNIEVNFKSSKKMLNLTVSDDGVGFDITKGKKGIGLKNIISRVKKIDGSLKVDSIPNKGSTISINFPYNIVIEEHPKPLSVRNTVQEEV